jgi:hypothetical protein
MERTFSSYSLQDTELDEESLGIKEQIGVDNFDSNKTTNLDVKKKRNNSAQAFSSFSYTNYWQLGELGSRNDDYK